MTAESKNFLLLVADDLGRDYLNCYGNTTIKTPHIDALAAEGTRFTNAFASTASCSGSRSTIYTGLHTHQNGQYGLEHGWNHFQTHSHIDTAPLIFTSVGYQTGIIGKVHVGPRNVYPWEVYDASPSRNVKWVAERAASFFDRAQESKRSFHLTIGFTDPHRDETRGGFANDFKEVLDAGLDDEVPGYGPREVQVQPFMSDVDELRTELVQYYKSISRMDLGVGLVLKALADRGLNENTLVVFISDNGAPFVNAKTTLYDAGVQLPLIIRRPGQEKGIVNPNMVSFLDVLPTAIDWAGKKVQDIVTPNAGKSPKRLGDSVLPILEQRELLPAKQWKQHVFGSHTFHEVQNYWPTRTLRTHRYKYHRNIAHRLDFPFATDLYCSLYWEGVRNKDGPVVIGKRPLEQYLFRGPEELYDLENDPDEIHNLIDNTGNAETGAGEAVLRTCRETLEAWQYETRDTWLYRDGVSAVIVEPYITLGLKLPDRPELDLRNPGTRHVRGWTPPGREVGSEKRSSILGSLGSWWWGK
ncbi:putative n-sulfoglucosamine sulfohydrolase protein [Teratosphaeria destructans]|uniref:N-sulfoglucosamine sulfohydrolase protein n=1 Tax=Teratosphaeria destructans TaxID=418781 RepID=A0A9W7W1E6_9PEZI|nr:putative n-sulfoglucosamine sulfohydrolase protein [Teratosphaeria destructans]